MLFAEIYCCISVIAVLDFTLSPTERFCLLAVTPNEGFNRTAQLLLSLIASFGIRPVQKAKYDLNQVEPLSGSGSEMTLEAPLQSRQPLPVARAAVQDSVNLQVLRLVCDKAVEEALKVRSPLPFRKLYPVSPRARFNCGRER
jgi:hypothetical protein